MLASIHPLGERARGSRFGHTAAAYLAGSVLGGGTAGVLLGLGGRLVRWYTRPSAAAVAAVVAIACLLGAAADLLLSPAALPTVRRQVNEDWLSRYRGWVYGLGFGFQLGLGVVTIVTTAAVYVALLVALLAGWAAPHLTAGLWAGGTIGAVFGAARAAPLLALGRSRSPVALQGTHRLLASKSALARHLAAAGLLLTAALAAARVLV